MGRTVVILIDELEEAGGTELSLLALAVGLQRGGAWRPVFCVLGRDGLVHRFEEAGIEAVRLPVARALGPEAVGGVRRIAAVLRERGAAVVQTVHTAADLLGPPAARLCHVPVLSNRRDTGFTKARRHRLAQRLVNPLVGRVICVSEAALEAARDQEGWGDDSRLTVVVNGVDTQRFGPAPEPDPALRAALGLPTDRPIVGYLGALTPVKGPDVLLDAVAASAGRWHTLVVGGGPLRGEDGPRVTWAGERRDVPELMRGAMDVFCLPSRSEGLSNSLLEAMASGLPVVATRVGGNPDVLGDPTDRGVLVPSEDATALAEALDGLAGDPAARGRLGGAGRALVQERYSVDAMVAAYSREYEALAGKAAESGAVGA